MFAATYMLHACSNRIELIVVMSSSSRMKKFDIIYRDYVTMLANKNDVVVQF